MDRRAFLQAAMGTAACGLLPLHAAAQALRGKVKITDVKCMIVRGTWDWNLIKIETDAGIYGIGEAYWGPGVKDLVLNQLKPLVIGRRSAQRRQALHQDADAERRRGRDRRRHRHGRQRHRDRALGSGRPPPADAGLQSARRTLSRPRPLLSHDAGGGASRGSAGVARPGARGEGREVRLDRVQVSGRRHSAARPIPSTRSPATTATRAASRSRICAASARRWRSCARSSAPTSTSASRRTGNTTCATRSRWRRRSSRPSRCGSRIRCRRGIPRRWRA